MLLLWISLQLTLTFSPSPSTGDAAFEAFAAGFQLWKVEAAAEMAAAPVSTRLCGCSCWGETPAAHQRLRRYDIYGAHRHLALQLGLVDVGRFFATFLGLSDSTGGSQTSAAPEMDWKGRYMYSGQRLGNMLIGQIWARNWGRHLTIQIWICAMVCLEHHVQGFAACEVKTASA